MTTFIMPTAPGPSTTTPPGQTSTGYMNTSPTHYLYQQAQVQPQYHAQQSFYSQQAPVSPLTSQTTSPHNASPTSPRASLNQQLPNNIINTNNNNNNNAVVVNNLPLQQARNLQLRPPKSPLYVPAVLRPTEPPKSKRILKPSPLTPPQSTSSSFDDLQSARPLSRRSTVDSGKFGLGRDGNRIEVTRRHWLPDTSAPTCTHASCLRPFSFYNRRHHCRRCGHIFCSAHSVHSIPLDADANFDIDGAIVRSCEGCYEEFESWDSAQRSRSNSEDSSVIDAAVPASPAVGISSGNGKGKALKGLLGKGVEMGQSVPRDWSWSTF